jgi:hypothetical protein
VCLVPSAAGGQTIDPRARISVHPEQLSLGVHVETAPLIGFVFARASTSATT